MVERLIERHPQISVSATEKFGRACTSVSVEDIASFYKKLVETLTNNKYGYKFLDSPNRIFNCDETAMEFDVISKFVCTKKRQKFVSVQCRGMHEKVSVLSCVSASGTSLPHLFIYKSLSGKIPKYVTNGAEEFTMFQGQNLGWMSKDIYLKWFKEQFPKFSLAERPLLLLFDGLKTHARIKLIEASEESQILLYCLPAHSSHLLQLLDLSVFGSLETRWKRVANTFNHFTGRVINQYNFAHLFKLAWNCSIDYII